MAFSTFLKIQSNVAMTSKPRASAHSQDMKPTDLPSSRRLLNVQLSARSNYVQERLEQTACAWKTGPCRRKAMGTRTEGVRLGGSTRL